MKGGLTGSLYTQKCDVICTVNTIWSAVCEGTRRPLEGEADGLGVGAGEGTEAGAGAGLAEGMDQVKGRNAGFAGEVGLLR